MKGAAMPETDYSVRELTADECEALSLDPSCRATDGKPYLLLSPPTGPKVTVYRVPCVEYVTVTDGRVTKVVVQQPMTLDAATWESGYEGDDNAIPSYWDVPWNDLDALSWLSVES
jgi:hypothetical protein